MTATDVPPHLPPPYLQTLPLLMAFDLDGTLVPELGGEVPADTTEALRRLHRLGVRLCVITGRDKVPQSIAEAAPFDALCSQNGGRVEVGGEVQRRAEFAPSELEAVLEHGLEGARLIVYAEGVLYMDLLEGEQVPDWIATRGHRPLHEAQGQRAEKVSFYHPEVARYAAKLRASHPHLVLTGAQPPYEQYLTVTPAGAHKGVALLYVAQALGIPPVRCIAFGDTDNDLAMFEVAGYAVQLGDLPLLAPHAGARMSGPEALGGYLHAWAEALAITTEAEAAEAGA